MARWDSVPGQREVVDERAAGAGGESARGEDGGDPAADDEAAVVVGKGGKSAHSARLHTECKIASNVILRMSVATCYDSGGSWASGRRKKEQHAQGDRGRRDRALRRARLPGHDDRRHRRGRRHLAAHVLLVLPSRRRTCSSPTRSRRSPSCERVLRERPAGSRPSTRCARGSPTTVAELEKPKDRDRLIREHRRERRDAAGPRARDHGPLRGAHRRGGRRRPRRRAGRHAPADGRRSGGRRDVVHARPRRGRGRCRTASAPMERFDEAIAFLRAGTSALMLASPTWPTAPPSSRSFRRRSCCGCSTRPCACCCALPRTGWPAGSSCC